MRPISPPGPISSMPVPNPSAQQLANRLRSLRARQGMNIEVPPDLVTQIISSLEGYDTRVTGLIRANSTEVVKRRVLNARLKIALEALQSGARWFRDYGRQHREKDTMDGALKAKINDDRAYVIEQAMIVEINPDDYGRP